jgi:dUTP pyrophosphatase
MIDINYMREKVLRMIDPDDPYNEQDFNKEFSHEGVSKLIKDEDYTKIDINFKNESKNADPEYATSGSSGFDIRANIDKTIKLAPQGGFAIIPTGLYFELPENFEIQVRSRSGLAAKNQVCVLNSPGTVDADYRGEIKIILINHGLNEFHVENGDRVAQGVISSVIGKKVINLNKVKEINENTERGFGGFGSTGKN